MSVVSIVIPAYNAQRWIAQTLESVAVQSVDAETILIDDGSTDLTAQLVAEDFPWVKLYRTSNQGVSAARNFGTDQATGEFIQYVDADDLLVAGAIGHRLEALKESGADVAYSDWQRLIESEDGSFSPGAVVDHTIESVDEDAQIAAFTDFWAPPVALLYRRTIVDRIGRWNPRLPIIQDARFLLDAALHNGRFVHVAGVGAYYRLRGSSLSRRSAIDFVRDCYTNGVEVEHWWTEHGGLDASRRRALVRVYGQVARGSYENDRETFDLAYAALRRLDQRYIPSSPRHLNLTSKLIGYPRAEELALHYRRTKRFLSGGKANA